MNKLVFVFGSNTQGQHIGGAARFAFNHRDAIMGQAEGLQGMSYAIPTCGAAMGLGHHPPIQLADIKGYVDNFVAFASAHPEMEFQVTRIGCGIAGFKDEEIAPLFASAPMNCLMPPEWESLCPKHNFWSE